MENFPLEKNYNGKRNVKKSEWKRKTEKKNLISWLRARVTMEKRKRGNR